MEDDMVLEAVTWPRGTGAKRVWRSQFRAISSAEPPPPEGVVRIEQLTGDWVIRAGPDQRGSTLIYTNHVELDGPIPTFLVESVRTKKMLELLSGLQRRCADVYLDRRPEK